MPYAGPGASTAKRTNALGVAASTTRPKKKKAKKKDDGGNGFLGLGVGPDVSIDLGVDNVLRDLAGMPGGIYRGLLKPAVAIPAAAATGGDVGKAFEPLGEFGAGMTASLAGTLGDAVDVAVPTGLVGKIIGKDLSAGGLVRDAYNEGVRALVPGTAADDFAVENYGAKSFGQKYRERGLLSTGLETVGNVALAAGGVAGSAGLSARALGTGTEAGAAALRVSEAARPWMTPLKSSYTKGVRPVTRAAQVADEATTGLERPVAGATREVRTLGPKGTAALSKMPESVQRSMRWLEGHSEARDWRRDLATSRRLGTSERHTILRGKHNEALSHAADAIQAEARAQGVRIGRRAAGDLAAEQASAQIRGVDRFISPEGLSPEAQAAADAIDLQGVLAEDGVGLRAKERLPQSLLTEKVKSSIDRVETEYRIAEARDARAKATAVRLGAQGLEDMDATTPRLTRGQERLNREALKLANRASFWRERVPKHMQAAYNRLAKAEAGLLAMDDTITEMSSRRATLAGELDDLRKYGSEGTKPQTARQLARSTKGGENPAAATLKRRISEGEARLRELETEIVRHQTAREKAALAADAARRVPDGETGAAALKRGEQIGRADQAVKASSQAAQRAVTEAQGVQTVLDTMKATEPGEGATQALQRGVSVAHKVRDIEAMTKRVAERQKALTKATASVEQMRQAFIAQDVPAAVKAAYYDGRRLRTVEKLVKSVDDTSPSNWPRRYQDLGRALTRMRDQVAQYPELEPILAELPTTFSEAVARMQELGIDPAYIGDLTENQVMQSVYGNLRLFGHKAGQEVEGSFRKRNTGRASAANAVDRGAESLSAGFVKTVEEAHTNALVDTIDQHHARPVEPGTSYDPKVWEAWDPMRSGLLTGTLPDGKVVAGQNVQYVIPKQLAETLRAQAKDYNHGVWKSINKVTSAWRAFVLTLSPRWYVNNTLGNAVLATAEGATVDLKAWGKAWGDFRSGNKGAGYRWQDSPGIAGHSMVSDLGDPTVLLKEPGRNSVAAAWGDADGVGTKIKSANAAAAHGLRRANEVVDEFARSLTYWHSINKGLSPAQALERSYKALIDYGDLSPFEQTVVRSLVPFYAWQKGILKVVAQVPIDHPIAMAVMMRLGNMHQEHVSESMFGGGVVPTAYAGLIGLPGGGAINPRGSNPFQDSASLVTVEGIAGSLNPFVEVLVRKAMGAPEGGFIDQYRMGPYGLVGPDISVQESVLKDIIGTVPLAQLVESATGTGRVKAGPLQQTARFAGVPVMTPADMQRARERAAQAAYMIEHQTPYAPTKKKKSTAKPALPAALGGSR